MAHNGIATHWYCRNCRPRRMPLTQTRCRCCGADRLRYGSVAPKATSADDLRARGWAVAVHNDYLQEGKPHTFWLFTKGILCVKGEDETDAAAIKKAAWLADRFDLLVFDSNRAGRFGDVLYWWQLEILDIERLANKALEAAANGVGS